MSNSPRKSSSKTPPAPLSTTDLVNIQHETEVITSKSDAFRTIGMFLRHMHDDPATGQRLYELIDSISKDVQKAAADVRKIVLPHLILATRDNKDTDH